ncbi:MAG: glycosyl transferase [Dictyoglomus sp. NZ13-RE01]|nr:MAG: glycosyl transferase [Dictyoglomus sp. NZ13-RE01]
MKIAFFTNNYLPNTGGAAISVETYRKALEDLGHEVMVFAPSYPPWFPPYDDTNKKIWRFPSIFLKKITIHPIPIWFTRKVYKAFEEFNPDIIHSHHPYVIGKVALKISKKYKKPIVFTYHTQYHKYVHYIPIIPTKIKEIYAIKSSVYYANSVDRVIAPTEELKALIKSFGVKKEIEVLPTGIDLKLWEKADPKKYLNNKPWQGKKILLYTGRLAKEKNIEFLLYSLSDLLIKRDDVVLLIVGDGDERKNLEELKNKLNLGNKVYFLGWYPREELVHFYSMADIFVFSSTTETQGLVTLEAMAGGCAVVAVKAIGSESLVTNGVEGFLTDLNYDHFKNKVEYLLDNPEILQRMKSNAKIKAEEYSVQNLAIKLIEIYRKTIKERENRKFLLNKSK